MDDELDLEGKFQNTIIYILYIKTIYMPLQTIWWYFKTFYLFAEETNLPDGTYPIRLSPITQERLDCVIDWDLSPLEPHKVIVMEKVVKDLQELGEGSDFWPLKHQITVSMFVKAFFLLEWKAIKKYYIIDYYCNIE